MLKNAFSKVFIAYLALLVGPSLVRAQESQEQEYSLRTPYQTILTHLKYLQDDEYYPEVAAKVFLPGTLSDKQAIDYAIKLKQVLDGRGIFIRLEEIPNRTDHRDSISGFRRYYVTKKLPDLYVEKVGNNWYYSQRSVGKILEWYQDTYPYGMDKLLEILPKTSNQKFFGLYLWQHIGILVIIVLCFLLHKLFTFVFKKLILRVLLRYGHEKLAEEVVKPIAKPISFLIIFPLLILAVPVLQLPIDTSRWVIMALKAIWPVFAIVFFYRLVNIFSLYLEKMAAKTESTLDDQLVPLLRKVLKTFVVVIGILFILDNLDVNITGILAGISIGGLAFALAAQDTLKNFFGSLMIFIDKPFQVGDWITSNDVDGTVEEVGFRATRIRTFRNSVMYIPNGVITNQTIDNHGLRKYRRFYTKLAVTYDTPTELIELFVEGLKEIVLKHPKTRKDYYEVHFNDLGDSSLSVMFYIFFVVPTWSEELRSRHEVLISIVKLAEELGVNFAFPTRTLHMETFPEKKGNSPEYTQSTPELRKKLESFLNELEAEAEAKS